MKNLNKGSSLLSILLLLFVISESKAQSVQRQVVASAGSEMNDNGVLVQQTIGQAYSTTAFYSSKLACRPGFQQAPVSISLKVLENTFQTLKLMVYPNPAANNVTIKSTENIDEAMLKVVDVTGKVILAKKINEMDSHNINCDKWANGLYFITLSDNQNKIYSSELIINK